MELKPEIKSCKPWLTMVIPVFNEAPVITKSVTKIIEALDKIGEDFEIIISDDGSTDNTPSIVRNLVARNNTIRYLRNELNLGRGEALTKAFLMSRGQVITFTDSDLATDLATLPVLIQKIQEGYDVSTGSRWLQGSMVERSPLRWVISFFYNKLVRLLFCSKLTDHQCGFKAFKRDVIMSLLEEVGVRHDRGWAWDTEVLIRAQRRGFRVAEFPVRWRAGERSKFRPINHVLQVATYLVKLRMRLNKETGKERIRREHTYGN